MDEVADIFLRGLRENKFSIISPDELDTDYQNRVICLLNEAWNMFRNNSEAFRAWEENKIQVLNISLLRK